MERGPRCDGINEGIDERYPAPVPVTADLSTLLCLVSHLVAIIHPSRYISLPGIYLRKVGPVLIPQASIRELNPYEIWIEPHPTLSPLFSLFPPNQSMLSFLSFPAFYLL